MTRTPLRFLLLASIGALALAACQEAAPPAAAPEAETVIAEADLGESPLPDDAVKLPKMECGPGGFITAETTREALVATFGAENIAEEEVAWVDSSEIAVVLFPNEPATRTELFWFEKTSGGPRYVSAGGPESQWIGPGGLYVGASLAEVEAANGGPFEMMGFQNHSAGEVTDWLGGALAAKPGDTCEFAMVLGLSPDAASEAVTAVSGDPDKVYRSDSPEMRSANPSVDALALHFFDPS